MHKILILIIIIIFSQGVVGEIIPFAQDGRKASGVLIEGWEDMSLYIYRPSYSWYINMFQLAVSQSFVGYRVERIQLEEASFQYVIFIPAIIGIVARSKVALTDGPLLNCYIYSQYNPMDHIWRLNNYHCEVGRVK